MNIIKQPTMRKFYTYLLLLALSSFHFSLVAQNGVNKEKFRLSIKKATDKISIDGNLNEQSWKRADVAKDFTNKWPTDIGSPPFQTEVKVTYDDTYIYIGAKCYDDSPNYIIQSLKRDDVIWASDGLAVVLDPVGQQTNGFVFYSNALGVQTEGLVSALSGGDEGMSRDWDNKWFVETTNEADGTWYVEMAIPFKTLRYDASISEWGINFLRCDVGSNMYSTWAHIPLQLDGTDLSYAGAMIWDNPPKKTNSNFSIIPYITGDVSQDFEAGETSPQFNYDAGLDAKVAVTSSLNLDLTINPDFSQIEVDQQQTNLTRFSLFFPERRTFFLENSDLFADFGIRPIRPFFSRRIGLDNDGNAIPILGGARLSGNLTESLRIGAMSMQTAQTETTLGQNYSVVSMQQRLLKRSSFKAIVINRQAFNDGSFDKQDFGRNAGGEFNYITASGNFGVWAGVHGSYKPEQFKQNYFTNSGVFYTSKKWDAVLSLASTGTNYIADAGFVQRLDNYDAARDTTIRLGNQHIYTNVSYSIYPEKEESKVNFYQIQFEGFTTWLQRDWMNNYRNVDLGVVTFFKNSQFLRIGTTLTSEYLPFETNFTGDEYDNLEADWYNYMNANLFYMSNQRKLLNYELRGGYGSFYNGSLLSVGGSLKYRKQPWGNFELAFEHNNIQFPENYGSAKLWLLGPRIGVNFSKNMFWTTFIQYNSQADNFNINSRFQWRFQPMSDLYLVYTDNYEASIFAPKSRALVLKLNYWLTI